MPTALTSHLSRKLVPGKSWELGAPHIFGEDTASVLGELGYSRAHIDDLTAKGVIKLADMSQAVNAG